MKSKMSLFLIKLIIFFILAIPCLVSCGGGGGGGSQEQGTSNEDTLIKVKDSLAFPIRIAEISSNELLVAELLTGEISKFNLESNEKTSIIRLAPANSDLIGISGLLVDKNFNGNGLVYVYHLDDISNKNIVTRLKINNNKVVDRKIILFLNPPSGHSGGGMIQAEDGTIYLGIGDGGVPEFSQNQHTTLGKIIAFNNSGKFINTNQISNGVFATGLRNPFGLTADDKMVFISDNGPDCDDEINLLMPSANYGWNTNYQCSQNINGITSPVFSWSKSEGITDLAFINLNSVERLKNSLLVARYNTKSLSLLKLNSDKSQVVSEDLILSNANEGPFIDILVMKDGKVFVTSQTTIYAGHF